MNLILLLYELILLCYVLATDNQDQTESMPQDFVNIKDFIPDVQKDIRYYSSHNFVGRQINGYLAPRCLLTKPAAIALKKVALELLSQNLTLKFYDCYRPQRAVNDFIQWVEQVNDILMKDEFYPEVDKQNVFRDGYLAQKSGHSRGSTVDLTIVPINSTIPQYDPKAKLTSCTSPQDMRFPDNMLDFGTGFDCFSPISNPDYEKLPQKVLALRRFFKNLMILAGFRISDTEWWHFTLINEPYPSTYFDFPIIQPKKIKGAFNLQKIKEKEIFKCINE